MKLELFQIDAFTGKVFSGNPAAVCPLDAWVEDDMMQAIAAENNLSETAFFVRQGDQYHIRWFTPVDEVDLCGHATLASAYVIFSYFEKSGKTIHFTSKSGSLFVGKKDDMIILDFPSKPPKNCPAPDALLQGLRMKPHQVLSEEDYFAVYESEEEILALDPNMELLKSLDLRGIVVTAPGDDVDFVSRFFAPRLGIDEDPVTGSAHCLLVPYWSERLKRKKLYAKQLSKRGGELFCEDKGSRVLISGKAAEYLKGEIRI